MGLTKKALYTNILHSYFTNYLRNKIEYLCHTLVDCLMKFCGPQVPKQEILQPDYWTCSPNSGAGCLSEIVSRQIQLLMSQFPFKHIVHSPSSWSPCRLFTSVSRIVIQCIKMPPDNTFIKLRIRILVDNSTESHIMWYKTFMKWS
jgi:hypothetical protein